MVAEVIRSRHNISSIDKATIAAARRRPVVGTITVTSTNRHRWIFVTMATWMVASLAGRTVLSFSFRSRGGRTMSMIQQQHYNYHHSHPPKTATAAFSSVSSSFQGSRQQFRIVAGKRAYGSSALNMMPEGPEVRTLVDQLRGGIGKRLVDIRFLSGRYVGQRPVGFTDFAKTMTPIVSQQQNNSSSRDDSNNNNNNGKVGTTIDNILDWNCKGKFIYILMDDGTRAFASQNSSNTDTSNVDDKYDDDDDDDDDDFQRSIWITLGMTGRFVNEARHLEDPSYGRWVLELFDENGNTNTNTTDAVSEKSQSLLHKIYYHDKRNFGTVKFCLSKAELDQKLNTLGPDVLALARQTQIIAKVVVVDDKNKNEIDIHIENDDPSITIDDELDARKADAFATTAYLELLEKQRNPRLNVCKFLMDQKKIAGVGNYILSEALYRSDIDPFCGIDELSTSQRIRLFREIQAVCFESYRSQHKSSATEGVGTGYTSVQMLEPFSFELRVYGKIQGSCPKGNLVIRETNGPHGRTIWYTEHQLFVARNIREQRERQLQEQLQQQKQQQQQQQHQNTPTASALEEMKNDPWTITRRDGVDLMGASNNDDGGDDSANAIKKEEEIDKTEASTTITTTWNLLDGLTEPGWKKALEPYAASSESFATLQDFLQEEYSYYGKDQIYPPPHQIFSALNLCPLDKVKIVILGQDPYHGPNQSTGLAFSVSKQISKIPPSLRNIFKELDDDLSSSEKPPPPEIRHGDLEGWAKQGVLMLNTVLTVRRGQANSHQKKGWEEFTDEIVSILKDRADNSSSGSNSSNGMVFLLWGGPASKKAKSIFDSETDHVVITTSHPSPLGATKTASPFLTSECFSRANAALVELGQDPIDWYDR
jgi:uracil-DNA glycosylase